MRWSNPNEQGHAMPTDEQTPSAALATLRDMTPNAGALSRARLRFHDDALADALERLWDDETAVPYVANVIGLDREVLLTTLAHTYLELALVCLELDRREIHHPRHHTNKEHDHAADPLRRKPRAREGAPDPDRRD